MISLLLGFGSVKTQLKRIRAILLKNKDSNEKLNLHMCFYGNPGTCKTVVARLMANVFYETGVLPTNRTMEDGDKNNNNERIIRLNDVEQYYKEIKIIL